MELTKNEPGQYGRALAMAVALEESMESGMGSRPTRRCTSVYLSVGQLHGNVKKPSLKLLRKGLFARGIDALTNDGQGLAHCYAYHLRPIGQADAPACD